MPVYYSGPGPTVIRKPVNPENGGVPRALPETSTKMPRDTTTPSEQNAPLDIPTSKMPRQIRAPRSPY